jgi:protein involved in polysaccharide export with SLBB domain
MLTLLIALPLAAEPPSKAAQAADVVGPGDLLAIGMLETGAKAELIKLCRVDEAGQVSLYWIIKPLKLGGMTFVDAEKEIAKTYTDLGLLHQPLVSLNRIETGAQAAAAGFKLGPIMPGEWVRVRIGGASGFMSRFLKVTDGGSVGVPMLGQTHVGGLSEAQAEQAITNDLANQSLVKNAMISVLRLPHGPPPSLMELEASDETVENGEGR